MRGILIDQLLSPGCDHHIRRYSGNRSFAGVKEQAMLVPEDIRLISLTGHSIGGMLETTMTSLEIPAHEMGKKAALMAIEEIDAPSDQKPSPQHLVFEATLVERESS